MPRADYDPRMTTPGRVLHAAASRACTAASLCAAALLLAASCARQDASGPGSADGLPPRVAATTTLVGDIVAAVGGEDIRLTVLLEPGQDPHAFEPRPADMAALHGVDVLFVNGLALETFLPSLTAALARSPRVVPVSEGIAPLESDHDCAGHGEDGHDHSPHGSGDPHVWFDPTLVARWVDAVERVLVELAPDRAAGYRARAEALRTRLAELDAWIAAETGRLPPAARRLVADHEVLNYFARRYGFEAGGVITRGFSTLAEPSARELARLEDEIRSHRVRAIFVGITVNPFLARRVAADTGVRVVPLHTGSLGGPGSGAETYIDFMRANVRAIVDGLAPGEGE